MKGDGVTTVPNKQVQHKYNTSTTQVQHKYNTSTTQVLNPPLVPVVY